MDRINSNPSIKVPPDLTVEEVESCVTIVHETLGQSFNVVAHLPRNVGVKGDSGQWGETVLITGEDQSALDNLHNDPDRLSNVSSHLTNRFHSLSRVLIDIVAQSPESTIETPSIDFVPNQL